MADASSVTASPPATRGERGPHASTALRTHPTGAVTAADADDEVRVCGWVHRVRDLGGLLFLDVRDRSGILQVSVGSGWTDEASLETGQGLGAEDVVRIEGTVALRPERDRNPEMATGQVELRARRIELLGDAETPAIPVYRAPEEELPSEQARLRHRVLDLRRPEMQARLGLRHRLVLATRNYLDRLGFWEVETPILTRPTPEGARDYLVPSRNHPGEFYALPQSPQIYKQLLMTAGFDRYFQIARCFRDEDLRADRQPEFTQIDLEASFVEPDDVLAWMEGLMAELASVAEVEARIPFERLTHEEVLDRWGTDRPDLRWDLEIRDWTGPLSGTEFRVLESVVDSGGRIRGFLLGGGARLSRSDLASLEETARGAGAPGLLWLKRTPDGASGPLARFTDEGHWAAMGLGEGDVALVAAGEDRVTGPALAAVRLEVLRALEVPPVREHAWLWVLDFPLFEEAEGGEVTYGHNPFVLPHPDDLHLLDSDPLEARGQAYDLVYNGSELGSGSIRIHEPGLQRRVLGLLGLSEEEIERKFGFLLEALASGAPPHGGIAFGMDRIVKDFTAAASLRDVIAFPKTTAARALFEGAPAPVEGKELDALGLALLRGEERASSDGE